MRWLVVKFVIVGLVWIGLRGGISFALRNVDRDPVEEFCGR